MLSPLSDRAGLGMRQEPEVLLRKLRPAKGGHGGLLLQAIPCLVELPGVRSRQDAIPVEVHLGDHLLNRITASMAGLLPSEVVIEPSSVR